MTRFAGLDPEGVDTARRLVRLIGYGWCPALPASELRAGMTRGLNYGAKEDIVAVETRGGWVYISCPQRTLRKRPDSLVAVRS